MINEREEKKKTLNFINKNTLFGITGKDFKTSIL